MLNYEYLSIQLDWETEKRSEVKREMEFLLACDCEFMETINDSVMEPTEVDSEGNCVKCGYHAKLHAFKNGRRTKRKVVIRDRQKRSPITVYDYFTLEKVAYYPSQTHMAMDMGVKQSSISDYFRKNQVKYRKQYILVKGKDSAIPNEILLRRK